MTFFMESTKSNLIDEILKLWIVRFKLHSNFANEIPFCRKIPYQNQLINIPKQKKNAKIKFFEMMINTRMVLEDHIDWLV